jgi:hypothetical protein
MVVLTNGNVLVGNMFILSKTKRKHNDTADISENNKNVHTEEGEFTTKRAH